MPKVPPRVAQILERWHGREGAVKRGGKPTEVVPAGRQIALGKNELGEVVRLPEASRLWHLHVIGPTGTGKSNFLEHVIRRDIEDGRGVMLIDPHGGEPGSVYRSVLSWMGRHDLTSAR